MRTASTMNASDIRGNRILRGMGFVLGTVALLLSLVFILVFVAHVSQRRDVELIDWKPTRSPEVEAQNEIDDVRQMVEAQNEMRRRRGAADLDAERLRAEVESKRSSACAAATRSSPTETAWRGR